MGATEWMFFAGAELLVFGIVMILALCSSWESSRECSMLQRRCWDQADELAKRGSLIEELQGRLNEAREALGEE